ncbi:MAG: hypothetical protein ABDH28_01270 [Brevinematia bacterium]
MVRFVPVLGLLFLLFVVDEVFSDEVKAQKKDERKYFEVYRVIGKGKDLKEARDDAYQNAIIEFLKKNVSPKDLKDNSEKILKEIFPSKRIVDFIESYKVISLDDSGDSVKIVIDIVVKVGNLVEALEKIKVPLVKHQEREKSPKGEIVE